MKMQLFNLIKFSNAISKGHEVDDEIKKLVEVIGAFFATEQLTAKKLNLREQNVKYSWEHLSNCLRRIKCQQSIILSHHLFKPLQSKLEITIAIVDQKISGPLRDFINGTSSKVQERGISYFRICADSLENIVSFSNNLSKLIHDFDFKQFVEVKKEFEDFLQEQLIDKLREKCSNFIEKRAARDEDLLHYVKVINIIKSRPIL
jgi:hypothetical protein